MMGVAPLAISSDARRRSWRTHSLALLLPLVLLVACTSSSEGEQTPTTAAETAPSSSGTGAQPTPTAGTDPSQVPSDPAGLVCWSAPPAEGSETVTFEDATARYELLAPLSGMHAHAAAWGGLLDENGPRLVVGTFANRPTENYQLRGAPGPSPDRLLVLDDEALSTVDPFSDALGRTSGAAFVDLDNDGDEDIVLTRNMRGRERSDLPSQVYRNDGDGYTTVDLDFGRLFSGRSIGVLDYNSDGLLDLLILEDRFSAEDSSVLLENRGDMQFRDATAAAGLPTGLHGLGIATSDLNGDGFTDVFVGGSNRMFLGGAEGFTEANSAALQWETFGNEDDVAGAAIADLNRDGLPDLVVGHHYNSTLSKGVLVPVRVYLNRGVDGSGIPQFEDVTEAAGMTGLATKAPHVEIADFDNDGWPDILTTASSADGSAPAVFRHLGGEPGAVPRFAPPPDLGSAQYWVTGPTADVDRDGRLDVLLVEWEPALPSLLLINQTSSGNWLEVSVGPEADQPAVGTLVEVWEPGHMGEPAHLLGVREIVATQGYTAGHLQVAHFGLGEVTEVDVRVRLPDGAHYQEAGLAANAHVRFPAGCSG